MGKRARRLSQCAAYTVVAAARGLGGVRDSAWSRLGAAPGVWLPVDVARAAVTFVKPEGNVIRDEPARTHAEACSRLQGSSATRLVVYYLLCRHEAHGSYRAEIRREVLKYLEEVVTWGGKRQQARGATRCRRRGRGPRGSSTAPRARGRAPRP